MRVPEWEIIEGADLPDLELFWHRDRESLVDFSAAHTWQLKVADAAGSVCFTKTTGITGAAGALPSTPNVTIAWGTADLGTLPEGLYTAQLRATRSADARERIRQWRIRVAPSI